MKFPKITNSDASPVPPKIVLEERADTALSENKENKENKENEDVQIKEISNVTLGDARDIPSRGKSFYKKTGGSRPKSDFFKKNLSAEAEYRLKFAREKYAKAPCIRPRLAQHEIQKERTTELPPFVQVETLHPGQTFVSIYVTIAKSRI